MLQRKRLCHSKSVLVLWLSAPPTFDLSSIVEYELDTYRTHFGISYSLTSCRSMLAFLHDSGVSEVLTNEYFGNSLNVQGCTLCVGESPAVSILKYIAAPLIKRKFCGLQRNNALAFKLSSEETDPTKEVFNRSGLEL